MKKLLPLLFVGVALCALAQTNPVTPSASGTNAPVHALPGAQAVSTLSSYLVLLIPIVVPLLIAALKNFIPKLPVWTLPIIAPALGALIDWIMQLSGMNTSGAITGALLGSAGVGIRELQNQVAQRIANPPAGPVWMPPNAPDRPPEVSSTPPPH